MYICAWNYLFISIYLQYIHVKFLTSFFYYYITTLGTVCYEKSTLCNLLQSYIYQKTKYKYCIIMLYLKKIKNTCI